VQYGDPVTATVEVDYDPASVDPGAIRVEPSFIPYVAISRPVVRALRRGAVSYTYTLLCVTDGCLPTRGERLVRLEPLAVTAGASSASGSWPVLRVSSRLNARDLSGPVRFRSPSVPPAPRYRIGPGALAGAMIAAAAVCVLAAIALLAAGLRRPARTRASTSGPSRLDLAIAYARDSARRSPSDRRRALSLLAEATDRGEGAVSVDAAESAWSRPSPTAVAATELADRASRLRGPDR
jgi:hypothetical protein